MKKLTLLAMAIGALLAFAIPAAASAATGQLTENGVPLKTGATFLATSTNVTTTTEAGKLSCEKVTLDLIVSSNSSSGSAASGSGTSSGCLLEGVNIPVNITTITIKSITLSSTGGKATFSFTFDSEGAKLKDCTITGTNVPVTWTPGTDTVHIAGSVVGSGSGCPTSGTIAGDFTLETADGTPLTID